MPAMLNRNLGAGHNLQQCDNTQMKFEWTGKKGKCPQDSQSVQMGWLDREMLSLRQTHALHTQTENA